MLNFISYFFNSRVGHDKFYYKAMHSIYGLYPNNIELYKLALIHKSASIVLDDGTYINNERLEYLGDAIIEAIVSDMLYVEYPYENEGFLTQLRSKIVSRNSLNALSEQLGLSELIVTQNNASSSKKHLYGDAFEAMIGAIYLDKGYDFVNRLLINRIFSRHLNLEQVTETETDYKSRLIEWCQKNKKNFSIQSKHGEEYTHTEPQFIAVVNISGKDYGYGIGSSKKEAEQRAAHNTLKEINSAKPKGGTSASARKPRAPRPPRTPRTETSANQEQKNTKTTDIKE